MADISKPIRWQIVHFFMQNQDKGPFKLLQMAAERWPNASAAEVQQAIDDTKRMIRKRIEIGASDAQALIDEVRATFGDEFAEQLASILATP